MAADPLDDLHRHRDGALLGGDVAGNPKQHVAPGRVIGGLGRDGDHLPGQRQLLLGRLGGLHLPAVDLADLDERFAARVAVGDREPARSTGAAGRDILVCGPYVLSGRQENGDQGASHPGRGRQTTHGGPPHLGKRGTAPQRGTVGHGNCRGLPIRVYIFE